MIFECNDLQRALESPELMPEARKHAEGCERCREELAVWNTLSAAAVQLHQEWESPALWPRIESDLRQAQRRPFAVWSWAFATAALMIATVALFQLGSNWQVPSRQTVTQGRTDLLTAETLRELKQSEAAYVRTIEKLNAAAGPALEQSSSPLASVYREKLLLLDSAIAELKANAEGNPYNAYLQTQLASMYREKQSTLEAWLKDAKSN